MWVSQGESNLRGAGTGVTQEGKNNPGLRSLGHLWLYCQAFSTTESNLAIIVLTGPLAYMINISFSLSVAGSPSPHLTGLRAKVEVTKGGGAGERLAHRHLRGWVM